MHFRLKTPPPHFEPPWLCVHCGYQMDAATPASGPPAKPNEGDLSLCFNCSAVYWREADRWRPITGAENNALDPEMKATILRVRAMRKKIILPDLAKGRGGRA